MGAWTEQKIDDVQGGRSWATLAAALRSGLAAQPSFNALESAMLTILHVGDPDDVAVIDVWPGTHEA